MDKTKAVKPFIYLAVALSLAVGAIHAWVMPEHFEEWWGYGCFFACGAFFQVVYGLLLLRWRVPLLLLVGMGGNLAIIALYIVTRAWGIFLGPHTGHVEEVGSIDLASTGMELALVAALAAILLAARKLGPSSEPSPPA